MTGDQHLHTARDMVQHLIATIDGHMAMDAFPPVTQPKSDPMLDRKWLHVPFLSYTSTLADNLRGVLSDIQDRTDQIEEGTVCAELAVSAIACHIAQDGCGALGSAHKILLEYVRGLASIIGAQLDYLLSQGQHLIDTTAEAPTVSSSPSATSDPPIKTSEDATPLESAQTAAPLSDGATTPDHATPFLNPTRTPGKFRYWGGASQLESSIASETSSVIIGGKPISTKPAKKTAFGGISCLGAQVASPLSDSKHHKSASVASSTSITSLLTERAGDAP